MSWNCLKFKYKIIVIVFISNSYSIEVIRVVLICTDRGNIIVFLSLIRGISVILGRREGE